MAIQSVNILHYSLIHLQFLQASNTKLMQVVSKMPFRFAVVTNKEISQLIRLFPKYTKEVTNFGLEVLPGRALSFLLEFIDKIGEKVFVYKCKLSLSLAYFI